MKMMDTYEKSLVSIITVHISVFARKRRLDYLINCIKSLERSAYRNFEIIVVFDKSTTTDADYISRNFPHIRVKLIEKRIGVTEGRNIGGRFAHGNYLIFLDEDTKAEPRWLEELMKVVSHSSPNVGMVGSLEAPYDEQASYPLLGVEGTVDIFGCAFDERKIRRKIDKKYSYFETLGFALLVKKEVFEKIGGYDERFNLFIPELDLCWRARLAGYHVVNAHFAVVRHARGITKTPYSHRKVYMLERNLLAALTKNYGLKTLTIILPLAFTQLITETLFFCFVGRLDLGLAVIRAIMWNLRHAKENWVWHLRTQRFRKVPDRKIMDEMLKKNVRAFKLLNYLSCR